MKAYREVAGGSGSAAPAFLVGTGRNRQWHTLFDSYCERPHCPGGEAVIRLRREGAGTPELTFLMDLREGTIEMGSDDRQEAGALAESFARDQWRLLARRRQVVRAWGLLNLRDREDYRWAKTYCFQDFEALTDHFALPFENQGRSWEVFDQYCVNPECRCADVWLQFYDFGKSGILMPEFVALLDLERGSVLDPDGRPLGPPAARVLEVFQDSLGDWRGELSLRKDLIRRIAVKRLRFRAGGPRVVTQEEVGRPLYREMTRLTIPVPTLKEKPPAASSPAARRSLAEAGKQPLVRDAARVGRNEPCPCGSGKKYKRCCGS